MKGSERPSVNGVESLVKVLGAATLAVYVLGLIAVNGYLFTYDVTDFSVIRIRFIYTGALLAALALLPYAVLRPDALVSRKATDGRERGFTRLLLTHLIPAVLIMLSVWSVGGWHQRGEWKRAALAVIPAYVTGIVLATTAHNALRLAGWITMTHTVPPWTPEPRPGRKEGRSPYTFQPALSYACTIFLLVAYICVFMLWSYETIPEQFGGGRPSYVWLLFRHESAPGARELSIPMCEDRPDLSDKLGLIYEEEDSYVVRVPASNDLPERVVRLKKETISAVITKHMGRPHNPECSKTSVAGRQQVD